MTVPAHLKACGECGHARGWHSGVCHATVIERTTERAPGMDAHVCRCKGFVPTAREARALQDAGLRGDLAPDAVYEALIGELEARDEALTVELDPSVADWTPACWECGQRIEAWADTVALPAGPSEDDEPTRVVFIHKRNCRPDQG
jgi:hypothetical protein